VPAPVPVLVPVLAVVRLLGPAQVQVQALLARGQETRSAAPRKPAHQQQSGKGNSEEN